VLLVGRLLSGISTSLLFSVFEAWMVYEHNKRGYSSQGLSQTFAYSTFGNGVVAIISGVVATPIADNYGYVAPFMVALALLLIGSAVVSMLWTENYGNANIDVAETFGNALSTIRSDYKIAILGMVQSLFEASMYTFVFMWTPALQEGNPEALPFGLIFAAYMVAIMIGSSLFQIIVVKLRMPPEIIAKYILGVAATSLFIPYISKSREVIALAFLIFELMCGLYFPCIGTLRGRYIPEASRSAIMNFFRVPLNLFVVLALMKVSSLSNSTVFAICTSWLFIALLLHLRFVSIVRSPTHRDQQDVVENEEKLLPNQEEIRDV